MEQLADQYRRGLISHQEYQLRMMQLSAALSRLNDLLSSLR